MTEFSMWDAPAEEITASKVAASTALAVAAVEPLWPFLAQAKTLPEFESRLDLSKDSLKSLVSQVVVDPNLPSGTIFLVAHDALRDRFRDHLAAAEDEALRTAVAASLAPFVAGGKTAGAIKWKGDTHFGADYLKGKAANGDNYEVYFNPNSNPTPCSWVNYGPKYDGDTAPLNGERKGVGRNFKTMQEAVAAAEADAAGMTAAKTAAPARQTVYKGTSTDWESDGDGPDKATLEGLIGKYVAVIFFNVNGVAADHEIGRITDVHEGKVSPLIEWKADGRDDSYPVEADQVYQIDRLEEPAPQHERLFAAKTAAKAGDKCAECGEAITEQQAAALNEDRDFIEHGDKGHLIRIESRKTANQTLDGVGLRLDNGDMIGWMEDWGAIYDKGWMDKGYVTPVDHNSGGLGGTSYRLTEQGKASLSSTAKTAYEDGEVGTYAVTCPGCNRSIHPDGGPCPLCGWPDKVNARDHEDKSPGFLDYLTHGLFPGGAFAAHKPDSGQRCPSCGQHEAHWVETDEKDEDGEPKSVLVCSNCDWGVGHTSAITAAFFQDVKQKFKDHEADEARYTGDDGLVVPHKKGEDPDEAKKRFKNTDPLDRPSNLFHDRTRAASHYTAGPLDRSVIWTLLLNLDPNFGGMDINESQVFTTRCLADWEKSNATDMHAFVKEWIADPENWMPTRPGEVTGSKTADYNPHTDHSFFPHHRRDQTDMVCRICGRPLDQQKDLSTAGFHWVHRGDENTNTDDYAQPVYPSSHQALPKWHEQPEGWDQQEFERFMTGSKTAAPYGDDSVEWAANRGPAYRKEMTIPDGRTGIVEQNTDGTYRWGIRGNQIMDDGDGWPGAWKMDGTQQVGYPTPEAAYEAMVARAPDTAPGGKYAHRRTAKWIDQARAIVESNTFKTVHPETGDETKTTWKSNGDIGHSNGGAVLDLFTASMLVQVYDALGPANQAKFDAMPLIQAVDIAWKLANKTKAIKTAAEYGTPEYAEEMAAWYRERENVTYTDGTRVQEGDHIRYHQAPGGLMAPGDWVYGVAAHLPESHQGRAFRINELHLLGEDGRYYNLFSHVIERANKTSAKTAAPMPGSEWYVPEPSGTKKCPGSGKVVRDTEGHMICPECLQQVTVNDDKISKHKMGSAVQALLQAEASDVTCAGCGKSVKSYQAHRRGDGSNVTSWCKECAKAKGWGSKDHYERAASRTAANPNFRTPEGCMCPPPRPEDPRGDRRKQLHWEIRDDAQFHSGPYTNNHGGPGSVSWAMMNLGETIGFGSTPDGPGLHVVEVQPGSPGGFDMAMDQHMDAVAPYTKVVGSKTSAVETLLAEGARDEDWLEVEGAFFHGPQQPQAPHPGQDPRGREISQEHDREQAGENDMERKRVQYWSEHPDEAARHMQQNAVRTAARHLAVGENLEGLQQGDDMNLPSNEPRTTRPRVMPPEHVRPEIALPTIEAPGQMGGGGGFDGGFAPQVDPMTPSVEQMVAARVARLAARVKVDNPSMSEAEARQIAAQTVAAYPEMVSVTR